MSAVHSATELRLGRNLETRRHPEVRHPVQRRTPDKQLRRLPLKTASTDSLAKYHLHAKDLRLSQRTAMVARRALPLSPSFAPDGSQVLIADVPFSLRVAMLPDACPLLWRDRRSRLSLSDGVITVAAVICSVSRDLAHIILNLLQQVGQQLRVLEIIGRDHYGYELKGRLVHSEMQFAPRSTATVSMLPHFPFALAIDLDAGGIHHHVQRIGLPQARQFNFQRAAATAKCRVTGDAHLDAEQANDRARQPFGGSERQMVNFFQSRHAEDGRVGIECRLASLARPHMVVPRSKNIFTDPDGETSALSESFVILTPVTETVRLLGSLFCHTSKIPAAPSP